MVLNAYVIKRYVFVIVACTSSAVLYFIGLLYSGMLMALLFVILGMILNVLLSYLMINNPFTQMLEGKGIVVIDINSTGLLQPFLVKIFPPKIRGRHNGEEVSDVWDREAAYNLKSPSKATQPGEQIIKDDKGCLSFNLTEEDYNKNKFQLSHLPVLFYNSQLRTFLTKDFFSNAEKDVFSEHGILQLNHNINDLGTILRDFSRQVIELSKPKTDWLKSPIFWGAIILVVLLLIFLFGPKILATIQGIYPAAQNAVSPVNGGGAITPR